MGEPEQIREHLESILASRGFRGSERLQRFLRFTVESKLRGEGGNIKEYLIGREVFDRGMDYDPRLDPIVRVEARRLRRTLDEFYAQQGSGDGFRIEYPKGSYVPEFRTIARSEVRRRSFPWWAVAGVAVLAAAAIWLLTKTAPAKGGLLAVVAGRWTWKVEDSPPLPNYDEEIAEMTAGELVNAYRQPVVAWPLLQRFAGGGKSIRDIADGVHAKRVLLVVVRLEAGGFRITGFLMDPVSGRKLGFYDVRAQPLDTAQQRRHAARELAAAVAKMAY